MSQASEFRLKYGVSGAGAVSKSIIGQLPGKAREIGPVSGVSFRVASRIANALRAGYAARSADDLNAAPVILFYSPRDHAAALVKLLEAAAIDWAGKSLVVCDCDVDRKALADLERRGASVAIARQFGLPRQIAIEGDARALLAANKMARSLRLHTIEIAPGTADVFDAAVTLSTAACTPLIDRTAEFLRIAGVRDVESSRLAAAMFELTARGYAHSGKQSWEWYVKKPDACRIESQIAAAGPETAPIFHELLLYALDVFEKHPELAEALRRRPSLTST